MSGISETMIKRLPIIFVATAMFFVQASGVSQNLIENGFGELGTSEGFSGSVFDGTDFVVGSGSFRYSSTSLSVMAGDLIPIEPGKRYRFSFYAKSNSPSVQAYSYTHLVQYDIDKNIINHWNIDFIPGTMTSLASNLDNGDTEIHLSDASNWVDSSVWYVRGVKFWDYSNSLGHVYDAGDYTRNYYTYASDGTQGIWNQGSGLDKPNGIIHLKAPWSSGARPAGSPIAQNNAGGHFYLKSNFLVPEEWTYYEFTIDPSYFTAATVFIRPGWLVNYGTPGSSMSICGVTFDILPDLPGITTKNGNVGIGATNPQNALDVNGTVRAKEVIVETNWADFVFDPEYRLPSLAEVEAHIAEKRSLPGVPTAAEVQQNGLSLAESQTLMMQKIEELTLYVIEKDKQIKELKTRLAALEVKNN